MNIFSKFCKRQKSGAIAKKRLKSILVSDRADCSTDLIHAIREDIGQSLSKYMEIDKKHMKVDIVSNDMGIDTHSKRVLVVRIPFNEINKVIC